MKIKDVKFPEGRIVMMFSDDTKDDYEEFFTDYPLNENKIKSYHVFDSPEEFLKFWWSIRLDPPGMWYWVVEEDYLVCSGACDPMDYDVFLEHWGLVELDTFPVDDTHYCKRFVAKKDDVIDVLEKIDSYNERKGVDFENFLENYIWDETDCIYQCLIDKGEIVLERDV